MSRADAGPVEIPQGPWPEHTYNLSRPGMRPMSGRPSSDWGRAHARQLRICASRSDGTNRTARARSGSTHASGSGRSRRNVDPIALTSGSGTKLNCAVGGASVICTARAFEMVVGSLFLLPVSGQRYLGALPARGWVNS
jgi:hypothetical protein